MIVVVTDSMLSYKDDVRALRDVHGATIHEMHPGLLEETNVRSKWSFVPPLVFPNVRRYRRAWTPDDDVIAIGWYIIPILWLMKLRLVKPPRVVVSYGTFIQSAKLRRIAMTIFGVLRHDRVYFISSSSIEDAELAARTKIDDAHRFVRPFRETAGLPACPSTGREFVFSGGFTNRDYDLFFQAVADLDSPVLVAAAPRNGLDEALPPHITLRTDVDPGAFERDIARSLAVVLPLKAGGGGSGQSVLLAALRYEKPLIVTKYPAIVDMLGEDFAGYVPAGDLDVMRALIRSCVSDPSVESELAGASAAARARLDTWPSMPDEMLSIIASVRAGR